MLYNNKFIQHNHHHESCHCDCKNMAHNHAHLSHDLNCHQDSIPSCGGDCHTDDCHTTAKKNQCDDSPDDPDRQSSQTKLIWKIKGMDCAHCAQKIENGLKTLPNICQTKIIFSTQKLAVFVPQKNEKTIKLIEDKVTELGYTPIFESTPEHTHHHEHSHGFDKKALIPLAVLGGLIVVSYLLLLFNKTAGEYAFIVTAIIGLIPILKEALILARSGTPFAIESLMSISAIGALFIGAAEEATMVIFLFMIGEMLEGVATSKARQGISSLAKLMPEETVIIIDGERKTIASHNLKPGDIIEISSGGRLPADVILISEQANIDESALTGESIPVNYLSGDKILAGSLVVDNTIELKVVSDVGQNAVDRILQLIEDAEERKAPIERFIDKFSRYYTPAIALLALLVIVVPPVLFNADWYTWFYRGLTLLLIGCPCALVISTPAVITSALSNAAKQGILIKGGAALEHIGSVKLVAFDKTGTLTEGKPQITDVINQNANSTEALLAIVAAIESGSHHPLAKAIVEYVKQNQIPFVEANNRKTIAGVGIQGEINQQIFYIVSPNKISTVSMALTDEQIKIVNQLETAGKTVIVAVTDQNLLGIIALQDVLRADAITAINQLHQLGLKTLMLTGDNERAAKQVAKQLNIDYRSQLLPTDKLAEIEKIRNTTAIAMVGDGINDSPAMKAASVGIAMGSGTDVALETADAALTQNSLLSLPKLIRLMRFAYRNIKQNITIALGIKLVFLVTSLLGFTGLWLAVLADSGATAIVTANALRVLKFKNKGE
ncbi:zinc/cadmium/mercury/lead-transporting ATPase [Gilliamella sp. Pra-s65]|uniref:zinc/cadmium/mercury/lead-transporting ATPase n=1 Tax=unclassified Gilliamella TaxID=2685620 RepID=UPI001365D2A5|nr:MULTISPECIES: zinc/cadmium/mercury/lead-transporting ATPase [unclassified Gilliamella]MWN90655.1 zinc/cadmium/mercury/lead-transporting ATPase [Gilliamella sp. Pra-s65]MWP73701.1 zinc/cadmium/mercury/lead-transporting ATPase [Gilliamella sp. Pra-s52]